jgi:hypothetical protein
LLHVELAMYDASNVRGSLYVNPEPPDGPKIKW